MQSKYLEDTFKNRIWPLFSAQFRTQNARAAYWNIVCQICNFLEKDFLDITAADAQNFFDALSSGDFKMKSGKRYSVGSIFIFHSQLRAVSNFIVENYNTFRDISYTPPFTFTRVEEPEQTLSYSYILSISDLKRILNSMRGSYLYLVMSLSFRLGLGTNDLIHLAPSDVQVAKNGRLVLVLDARSRSKKPRYLAVPEDLVPDLTAHLETVPSTAKTLFSNSRRSPLTRKTLDYIIKKATEKIGYKNVTLQRIRSSAGHHMSAAGATSSSVAIQLGINERWIYRFTGPLDELTGQASEKIKIG